MRLPTVANIQLNPKGLPQVDTVLRLTGDTSIYFRVYNNRAPLLAVDDEHCRVVLSVPDPEQVTTTDVDQVRRLAEAIDRYVTELEIRLHEQDMATGQVA